MSRRIRILRNPNKQPNSLNWKSNMSGQFTERELHKVRWLLVTGWTLLVFSSFYRPFSLWLTGADNRWSPFRVDLDHCIWVQGSCLLQDNYAVAPQIFWGIVIPLSVIILVVGGHETWRRICPLYFISQIPRYFGWQRKQGKVNPQTGTVRHDVVGVKPNSWLGKNFGYLQLALLFGGLNLRLLVANGNGVGFGLLAIASMAGALLVGYLFKGRSWCHYFCPMAPVQVFYTSNRGLLGSDAHLSPSASITQSMCRITDAKGQEKSACVSCQSPCIDIDAERAYWANIDRPERKLLFYGYFGLMLGFFAYSYLYAGNWEYYFSGAWSHDNQQLGSLFEPGFYVAGRSINIPKIIAVPLTLGCCTLVSYYAGLASEQLLTKWGNARQKNWSVIQIRHMCFIWIVFISFNVFFIFAGRPLLKLLPSEIELLFNAFCIIISTLWLQRNLPRNKAIYQRESLTESLRRQLQKLAINWQEFLEGRSINELNSNEVYVLAKVLPWFNRQSRHQVYRGVLQDALAEGKTQSADSLEMLQGMRSELQITTDEHYNILANLGVENPNLLDPSIQRNREDRLRLESYQRYLEVLLLDLVTYGTGETIEQAFLQKQGQIEAMRQEYSITNDEQEKVLLSMFHPNSALLLTSVQLLVNLQSWNARQQALDHSSAQRQGFYKILRVLIIDQQKLIVAKLFNVLEILVHEPVAIDIATTIGYLAPTAVGEILPLEIERNRLTPPIYQALTTPVSLTNHSLEINSGAGFNTGIVNSTAAQIIEIGHSPIPTVTVLEALNDLVYEINPVIQAVSLYILDQIDRPQGRAKATSLDGKVPPLMQETINKILVRPPADKQTNYRSITSPPIITTIEKLLLFRASKFFEPLKHQSLIYLARNSKIQVFKQDEMLCEQGTAANSLFLLISGAVRIDQEILDTGNTIGYPSILSKSVYRETVMAHAATVTVLVVAAAIFNNLIDQDPLVARTMLASIRSRL
jgi:Cyclic nucleotide-binding domain